MQEESDDIVFGLAGTKRELPESERKVSIAEAEAFCQKYSIDVHFEVSAKMNYLVDELFQEIVESVVARLDPKW